MREAISSRSKRSDEEKLLRLKEREAALRRDIQKREKALSEKRRKERTRALIEKGGLIDIVGLIDCDPQILTGALQDMAATLRNNPTQKEAWKREGARILALSPVERKEQGIGVP